MNENELRQKGYTKGQDGIWSKSRLGWQYGQIETKGREGAIVRIETV